MREPGLIVLSDEQKTSDVLSWKLVEGRVDVTFKSGRKYRFASNSAVILKPRRAVRIGRKRVTIDGVISDVARIVPFGGKAPSWYRVYWSKGGLGESVPARRIGFLSRSGADILHYFQEAVDRLPDKSGQPDPLKRIYGKYLRVHPGTVLSAYLAAKAGAPSRAWRRGSRAIFPFDTNLSQRAAVSAALRHPISIIGGPPGTGKTQTILNLVANIVGPGKGTVAVVAFNNQAVLNVSEKLRELGYGALVADLRRSEERRNFFAAEHPAPAFEASPYSPWRLAWLDGRFARRSRVERRLAVLNQARAAIALEQQHFAADHPGTVPGDSERASRKHRSARAIRRALMAIRRGERPGRFATAGQRRYPAQSGPPASVIGGREDLIAELEHLWYRRRLAELDVEIGRLKRRLEGASGKDLQAEYQRVSRRVLDGHLWRRYVGCPDTEFSEATYRSRFPDFRRRFPVLISTCHSLPLVIPTGELVDYLIIDEASQLDLLTAAPALGCARKVIVVGDEKQLPHIVDQSVASALKAPSEAYDFGKHNLLTSTRAVFGGQVPDTLLREHYRCDPEIIGFCNTQYYDGRLLILTPPRSSSGALQLRVPPPGNHMRAHLGGGLSNQREVDVIRREVLPDLNEPSEHIGLATPYRRQVDKLGSAVGGAVEADTIHKFQGREKPVIVMSAVVDGSWRGAAQLESFVDDPHLINVAVSRAKRRFILVADRAAIERGTHLRDLARYIRYHNVGVDEPESRVISVFDLLYKSHASQLDGLARRLRGRLRFKSEDIIWTVLCDLFAEVPYNGFDSCHEYFVRNLIGENLELSDKERAYVRNGARVDFVVYRKIDKSVAFVVEVDGFAFHENNPHQLSKDALKDSILAKAGIRLVRLPTTGSGEVERLREALDDACTGTSSLDVLLSAGASQRAVEPT